MDKERQSFFYSKIDNLIKNLKGKGCG